MVNQELNRQLQRLQGLIESTFESTGDNIELQGHWGKYLCVLAAGFLENAISVIYIDLVSKSSAGHVASYASSMLGRIQNPKAAKFVETARAFKKSWGDDLSAFFSDNVEVKEAIDSIMSNRHQIAHGKNTDISLARVKDYLKNSVKALNFIEQQCGQDRTETSSSPDTTASVEA